MRHSGTILGIKPEHNSTQRQTETTDNGLPLSIKVESTGIHVYGGGVKREKKLFMGTIRLHPIKMVVIPELTIIISNFRCKPESKQQKWVSTRVIKKKKRKDGLKSRPPSYKHDRFWKIQKEKNGLKS